MKGTIPGMILAIQYGVLAKGFLFLNQGVRLLTNTALILVSHGDMARETIKSAEMIVGKIDNAYAVSMDAGDGAEGLKRKIREVMNEAGDCNNIMIMVDLIGGTPSNTVATEFIRDQRVRLISGFNLGMVLEFFTYLTNDADKLKDHLIEVGKEGIKDVFKEIDRLING